MNAYAEIQAIHNELNARIKTLMRERAQLLSALTDALEALDNYSDTDDGPYGPVPNKAMAAQAYAERVLEKIAAEPIVVRCSCGRGYTAAQFDALPPPPKGDRQTYPADDEGPGYTLLYRNCPCRSTITRVQP